MRLPPAEEIFSGPMADTPPTYRPILMSAKNRQLTSANWEYGKPQLYGRAVESVQDSAREFLPSDAAHHLVASARKASHPSVTKPAGKAPLQPRRNKTWQSCPSR